jgi:hypothetical protein
MKMLKALVWLGFLVGFGVIAGMSSAANAATITDINTGGGVTEGHLQFSDFEVQTSASGGATMPDADSIDIQVFTNEFDDVVLQFGSAWIAANPGSFTNTIVRFKVTCLDDYYLTDNALGLLSCTTEEDGVTGVTESVFDIYPLDEGAEMIGRKTVYEGVPGTKLNDSLTWDTQPQEVWVNVNPYAMAGSSGYAQLGQFFVSFGTGGPIPEPATLTLLAVGGLALLRRKR